MSDRYQLEGYMEYDDHTSFFLRDNQKKETIMIVLEEFKIVVIRGDMAPYQIEVFDMVLHEDLDADGTEELTDEMDSEEDNSDN